MGWFNEAYSFRAPITIDNTGIALVESLLIVPPNWDHFWENVLASGLDIVITAADGETVLDFSRALTFDVPTRVGPFTIENYVTPAITGKVLAWIYYGNPDEVTSRSVVSSISVFMASAIYLGQPTAPKVQPSRRRRNQLGGLVEKTVAETVLVWWELDSLLERRRRAHEGSLRYEEVFTAEMAVFQDGEERANMKIEADMRFATDEQGRTWLGAPVTQGIDRQAFSLSVTIGTQIPALDSHRVLEPRALLRVQDLSEI